MTSFAERSLPPSDRDETPEKVVYFGGPAGGSMKDACGSFSLPVPDFFLGVSHDLFAIGALHRTERDAFNHALRMCSERRAEPLRLALSMIRANASRVRDLCVALENKLLDNGGKE